MIIIIQHGWHSVLPFNINPHYSEKCSDILSHQDHFALKGRLSCTHCGQSPVFPSIQSRTAATSDHTPGLCSLAQPSPHDVRPTSIHLPSFFITRGPPLSPCQENKMSHVKKVESFTQQQMSIMHSTMTIIIPFTCLPDIEASARNTVQNVVTGPFEMVVVNDSLILILASQQFQSYIEPLIQDNMYKPKLLCRRVWYLL